MIHFGIEVSSYDKLSKTKYIGYIKESDLQKNSKASIMKNYEDNMKYFEKLSNEEFNLTLNKFLKKYPDFQQIFNINDCNFSGYYIIVLDKYKQVYIGVAKNIKKRILEHWNKKPINLICRLPNDSKLCIDAFKALDTTRLYVYKKEHDYDIEFLNKMSEGTGQKPITLMEYLEINESEMIDKFNSKFTCNRYVRFAIKDYKRNFNN